MNSEAIAAKDARIRELEDCLREIERKLREETHAIMSLVQCSGSKDAIREWKSAIYGSCIRAQVFLCSPNATANKTP